MIGDPLPPGHLTPGHLTRGQSNAVARSRRTRNYAMLVILVTLALLFYALAFVKLGSH